MSENSAQNIFGNIIKDLKDKKNNHTSHTLFRVTHHRNIFNFIIET